MATYYYRAVTSAGRMEQGVQDGASEKGVARELQALGLVPVYVGLSQGDSATRSESWLSSFLNSIGTKSWSNLVGRRVTSHDRLRFTQELSTLLNAGVRWIALCRSV